MKEIYYVEGVYDAFLVSSENEALHNAKRCAAKILAFARHHTSSTGSLLLRRHAARLLGRNPAQE